MNKKEKMSFIARFYRWTRENRCEVPEDFRNSCGYKAMKPWQKELVDAYISGVVDVRDSEYDTVHYFDKAEPGWMNDE